MTQLWRSFGDLLPFAIPLVVIGLAALVIWPWVPVRFQKISGRVLLGAWVIAVLMVTLQEGMGIVDTNGVIHYRDVSLIPFEDLWNLAFHSVDFSVFVSQVGGNLLLFMPLGLDMALSGAPLRKRGVFVVGFAAGAVIEVAQWVLATGRVSSFDDALLAGIGTLVGYLLSRAILKQTSRRRLLTPCAPIRAPTER